MSKSVTKPMSERAARAEAKRIVELALAKHGTPRKSGEFVEVIDEIEREAYKWRMKAGFAIMIFNSAAPWSMAKKSAFVEAERETTRRIYAHLEPHVEALKAGFREAVAVWYKRYGHRKTRTA